MMGTWVQIWDRREPPHVLAAIRMLLAIVVLVDLLQLAMFDLVVPLYADVSEGGLAQIMGRDQLPWAYRLLGDGPRMAILCWAVTAISAAMFGVGLWTRLAGFAFVLASANLAQIMPPTDRAIDALVRNIVLILSCSGCHRAWAIDAWLRTRKWWDGCEVPAWPRLLIVAQMLILYGSAGFKKVGLSWTPIGDLSAIYLTLSDPSFGLVEASMLDRFYWATQLTTVATWTWEWLTPIAAFAWWCRATRSRPGRVRAFLNRTDFWRRWVTIGVLFHVGTILTMRLGMFPFGTLALYPAFFHPNEWRRWFGAKP
jgi:hypothetical protein